MRVIYGLALLFDRQADQVLTVFERQNRAELFHCIEMALSN